MTTKIRAWHFLPADRKLQYGDRRQVRAGQTLRVEYSPELCRRGLHASVRLIDALKHAPGPILSRVEVGGEIVQDEEKLAGTARKCLWWIDASRVLHEFAAEAALAALFAAGISDEALLAAPRAKLAWLKGKITDEQLNEAANSADVVAQIKYFAVDQQFYASRAARDSARQHATSAAQGAAYRAAYALGTGATLNAALAEQDALLLKLVRRARRTGK